MWGLSFLERLREAPHFNLSRGTTLARKPSCLCGECRKCKQREYMREYQRKNPEQNRAKAAAWRKQNPERRKAQARKRWLERSAQLDAIKLERGCAKCGYNEHPAALLFHHRDPAEKELNVSQLAARAWPVIEEELAKCDVLCGNCHLIHHYAKD